MRANGPPVQSPGWAQRTLGGWPPWIAAWKAAGGWMGAWDEWPAAFQAADVLWVPYPGFVPHPGL